MTLTQTRTQLCPACTLVIDNHTNDELVKCDEIITTHRWAQQHLAQRPMPVHESWDYRLPERYQA